MMDDHRSFSESAWENSKPHSAECPPSTTYRNCFLDYELFGLYNPSGSAVMSLQSADPQGAFFMIRSVVENQEISQKAAGLDEQRMRQLRDLLFGLMQKRGIHHAVISVENGDKSLRWAGVAGVAHPSGTPMTAETPFYIASISKLFTAAVVLSAYEAGRLKLDAPIRGYLADEVIQGLHRMKGQDYTEAITVRHLLSHTSGLPSYFDERPRGGQSLAERIMKEKDVSWGIEEVVRIARDELKPHFAPQPVNAQRHKARYSDTNFQILGAIVESVSGRPLHEVFKSELFEPLGLIGTRAPGVSSAADRIVQPATIWAQDEPLRLPQAMASMLPDGGLISTADDLIRFMRALVAGEVFRRSDTFALMQSRWHRFGIPFVAASPMAPNWPIEYGLGIMRFQMPRLFTPRRPMPAVIGHTGSTGTWLFYCPDLDLYMAGAVNQVTAAPVPYRVVPKLVRILG